MDALQAYSASDDESDGSSRSSRSSDGGCERATLPPRPPPDFVAPARAGASAADRFRVLVFLPLPDPAATPAFAAFLNRLSARARLLLVGASYKPALHRLEHGLHVSLSRTGVVSRVEIVPLLRALASAVAGTSAGSVTLTDRLVALPGQGRERCYLGAAVEGRCEERLVRLVRRVDGALAGIGLLPFFEEPKLHMSFTWAEGIEVLELLKREGGRDERGSPTSYDCSYNSILCTIGCQTHRISLS